MEKPVLWFHIPHLAPIANKLNSSGIVYYCIDNYSALPNVDKQSIQSMDYKMTEISDLVFVSSSPLFETKKNVAKDLIFSPHGVDFEHFNKSFNHHGIEKRIKSTVTRPVIGFWGLIEDRIDLELIKYLALKHQGWDFAMIGHVAVDDNPCSELSNVKFFGPKKYQELPEFANNFDLLILPYKNNEFVYNCNPIKLREYLATGKPVVSTYYPEIESYREFVGVANTYEEFSEWIQWFFENDNPELAMRRVDKVKGESWESRVEQIIETLHLKFNRNINHG